MCVICKVYYALNTKNTTNAYYTMQKYTKNAHLIRHNYFKNCAIKKPRFLRVLLTYEKQQLLFYYSIGYTGNFGSVHCLAF